MSTSKNAIAFLSSQFQTGVFVIRDNGYIQFETIKQYFGISNSKQIHAPQYARNGKTKRDKANPMRGVAKHMHATFNQTIKQRRQSNGGR